MGIYLNPRNECFQQALNSEIYVDKTGLIDFVNRHIYTEQKYICVSRPRRFGKSMAAHMLVAYYSRGCDSGKLFEGLKIAGSLTFEKHLNQYNVVHINMQDFLTRTNFVEELIALLERRVVREIKMQYPDVNYFEEGMLSCMEDVYSEKQIPFIFIIDEWDCIFRVHKEDKDAQKKYLDFLRNILKDKAYVALAYMTGILPIKKYGEHSALNMFDEYSMTDATPVEEYTGFTEEEVIALCKQYNRSYEELKEWYDGYHVNGISVYNPRSVVQTLMRGVIRNYWTKTETYEALKVYIQMDYDGLREKVGRLIAGEKIPVNTLTFVNDMTTFHSADDILTLLIHLGYLTFDYEESQCYIPNAEVQQEFINCVETGGWEQILHAIKQSEELLELTKACDEEAVARQIEAVHEENASILQYNNETTLSCVIALAYYSARKDYTIVREMPAGKGYADLLFLPDKNKDIPALVVELKCNQSAEAAIDQVKRKNYAKCLEKYQGEILLVGISYDKDTKKHFCKIEKVDK